MFNGMNGLEILKNWPRFEDDAPVRIGEDVDTRRGICTIKSVRLYDGSFTLYGEDKHGLFEVCHISWQDGERVKRPVVDTWERLEGDAEKDPCDYFGFDGEETCGKCPASGKNCEQTMARDLVRRCRALAERERGE